jgi:AraC-like DNA-binding protein
MAVTLIENLIKGGIKVPEDIAVTGYDAASDGYRSHPSVTSCKRPNFQLGAESFRRLYRIITGKICSKIQDETAELRLGRSCGCTENSDFKSDFLRRLKISENFSQQLIYGDMLTDITAPDRLEECINRIDNYTYLIYKMSRIIFCVTEKYKNSIHHFGEISLDYSEKEPIEIIFDKSAISRNNQTGTFKTSGEALKFICSSRSQPSAFYISPLHYNNNFFGFAALSFGKQPISYDRIYLQWLNYANMALEKVLIQSAMNNYLQKTDALASYDSLTGLLNRNGFITAFNEKVNSVPPGTSVSYIHIEISELKKLYYNNGYSKTSEIIKNFADILKFYSGADKICGTIAPGCCGLACFGDENPDDIFAAFKKSVQESPLFHGRGTVSFNAGICTVASSEHIDIWEMIYNASINSVHSFAKRERNTNPQFEKLCGLRSRMIKNPELMWNISEIAGSMFISKSYLQKIYKAYFGKSIIEELIEFRLDKAKKLLLETEMTVSDIALECGYSTYNYFVRQFRTSENISPSEYRNIHSNGGERT